jgi:hypothetical protein
MGQGKHNSDAWVQLRVPQREVDYRNRCIRVQKRPSPKQKVQNKTLDICCVFLIYQGMGLKRRIGRKRGESTD